MLDRLSTLPHHALVHETRKLELRLLNGVADGPEIDAFVALASELGRRAWRANELQCALDSILDPRD
ncbi:MAG: hypothetical protein P8Y02_05925 [Deinococcales bacterium]|jgi:hypothetical protein